MVKHHYFYGHFPWFFPPMASPSSVPCFAPTAAARRQRRLAAGRGRRTAVAQRLVELLLGDAVGDAFGFGIEMSLVEMWRF